MVRHIIAFLINPLGLGSLVSYDGWCRYGPGKRSWMGAYIVKKALECQQYCIDNTGCVAFTFIVDDCKYCENCYLYRGGPYTYGNGKAGHTCYIMKGKPDYVYYYV